MPSSQAKLSTLKFLAGFHRESTKYAEEGKWYDGDRVRFREGKPENLRGYQKLINAQIIGTPRDLITWANNNTQKLLSTGTEQRLYIVLGDTQYDITPIASVVSIAAGTNGNFNTSVGSPLIEVSLTNHNTSVGDWIYFTSTSVNGFGGATDFAASAFGGPVFAVASVSGVNHFYISVASVAASTETNMGNGVANFYIATQATTNIQGLGYGAGVYNAGVSTTGGRAWNRPASSSNIVFMANQWSLDNWGEDMLAVRRGGPLYHWDADASTSPARATLVSTAPAKINSIVVSPNDRHAIALGTYEYGTSVFNPLLVRWSDQEDFTNWVPSVSSTSGEVNLIDGTMLVGGIRSRNVIHVWTDKALYGLQYVGPPFIFNIQQLGTNCGLIGAHAAVAVDGVSYWMGDNNFYRFSGRVEKLNCTVRRYLYDSFNMSQKDKVYAGSNSEFNEIIWLYPSTNALEPDKYVIYNPVEDHWVYGTSFYTTFQDMDVFDNTVATGKTSNGNPVYYWNNEPVSVFSGDNQALTSYLESSDFDIEDGNRIMFMDKIIPDYDIENGAIQFSIKTKLYPNGPYVEKGPYTIGSNTQKIDLRSRGRQAAIRVSSSDKDIAWRWGSVRLAIQSDGDR